MVVPPHVEWLVNTGKTVITDEGQEVEIWQLNPEDDPATLSSWARHFRQHYCDDSLLNELIRGTGKTKAQWLNDIKFPDVSDPPGPSVRAGDFAEIIVADYIEYKLGYWCPRQLRYDHKWSRNESTKGCDVIGFHLEADGESRPGDRLFVFESKAAMSGKATNRLQDAVNDSGKDKLREATTLSALKQQMIETGDRDSARKVERFQDEADRPFRRISGAAAVIDSNIFEPDLIKRTTTEGHYNRHNIRLIVVTGPALMTLVHALYERAANEA